jgi:O-antigen/teichoic acid export membrane protein
MAMNTPIAALHTQPSETAAGLHESFFALFAGPLAWIAQLYSGYALASQACYPGSERRSTLPVHLGWTRAAIAIVMIAACLVSLLALASSLRSYRRSADEMRRNAAGVIREGVQRTCFLALWGIIFGAGAAVGSILALLAYFVLPQCAG